MMIMVLPSRYWSLFELFHQAYMIVGMVTPIPNFFLSYYKKKCRFLQMLIFAINSQEQGFVISSC